MIGALAPIAKLDVYLDLCCPFSKKMFMMIAGQVAPAYTEKADASRSRVEVVVHHVHVSHESDGGDTATLDERATADTDEHEDPHLLKKLN